MDLRAPDVDPDAYESAEEDEGLAFLRDHTLGETFGALLYP